MTNAEIAWKMANLLIAASVGLSGIVGFLFGILAVVHGMKERDRFFFGLGSASFIVGILLLAGAYSMLT